MSLAGDISQNDSTSVAEMAVEPSYISEIARKLMEVDPGWATLTENQAVRRTAKVVQALLDSNKNIEIERPSYGEFGGQEASSPKLSFSEDGKDTTYEWYPYTIIHNTSTDPDDVQEHIRSVINPSLTIRDKVEIADFISRQGNRTAKISEKILHDHVPSVVAKWDVLEFSDYNDPGLDLYVENFRSADNAKLTFENGLAIEVSTRWVNPIGVPYIDSKINHALDKEAKEAVQVDLAVLAPKFVNRVLERYGDSDVVTLHNLPFKPQGNPIIVRDDKEIQDRFEGSALVGDDYPVVEDGFEQFTDDLDYVFRDYHTVTELEYRRQISTLVGQVF